MIRAFLRSKIHRATVTHVDIDYEGSLSLEVEFFTPKIVLMEEGNQIAEVK